MDSTLEPILGALVIASTVILVRWNFLLLKERRKLKAELDDIKVLRRTSDAGVVLDENELWTDMGSWRREGFE